MLKIKFQSELLKIKTGKSHRKSMRVADSWVRAIISLVTLAQLVLLITGLEATVTMTNCRQYLSTCCTDDQDLELMWTLQWPCGCISYSSCPHGLWTMCPAPELHMSASCLPHHVAQSHRDSPALHTGGDYASTLIRLWSAPAMVWVSLLTCKAQNRIRSSSVFSITKIISPQWMNALLKWGGKLFLTTAFQLLRNKNTRSISY